MSKKLLRSPDNKIISGVCAGFAGYFGIDPTIVRIIWAIASFYWGVGILAYIICAFVMPEGSYFK